MTLLESIDYVESISGILVYRPTINFEPGIKEKLTVTKASVVAWAHVGPSQQTLKTLSELPSVKRVVALGERELISWYDNPVILKSTLIRNGHHVPRKDIAWEVDNESITYIGSLVPQKGFHLLAEVWPQISERFPNIHLNVAGSGNLYSSETGLGDRGIASPDYEALILRNLGSSINSVRFLGKIGGDQKNEIVAKSYVGIINPSGNTENCPLSALDFQSLGVPVLSARKYGVIDTVSHQETGLLFRSYKDLPNYLARMILNPSLRNQLASNCVPYIEEKFNFLDVVNQWDDLFSKINQPQSLEKVNFGDVANLQELVTIVNGKLRRWTDFKIPSMTVIEVNIFLKKIIRLIQKKYLGM